MEKKIKFEWEYKYGCKDDDPDTSVGYPRWGLNCYIWIDIKHLTQYNTWTVNRALHRIRIATMCQANCHPNGSFGYSSKRFSIILPSFDNCLNTGMSTEQYFYANDIEELKMITEFELNRGRQVWLNCVTE